MEGFYAKVMAGHPQGEDFARGMVEASIPELPPNATAAQLDAWVELAALLADESFIASMREQATSTWSRDVDQAAMHAARGTAAKEAGDARKRGVAPDSDEARTIATRFLESIARAGGTPKHDPRAGRYWELVGLMKGGHAPSDGYDAWRWLGAALKHHA